MFAADIVLDDVDGTDTTYRLVSQGAGFSDRIDIATSLSLPARLSIKHSTAGKGADVVDRHLVSLTRAFQDSTGKTVQTVVNFTMAVPRNPEVTVTLVADEVCRLIDFLSSGGLSTLASTANIESLARGES